MSWSPRAEWAARLNSVSFVDCAKARVLLDTLGPDRLARASAEEWGVEGGPGAEAAARWRRDALAFDAEGERRRVEALGARLLVLGEHGYPDLLASVTGAPLALYAWGRLSALPTVAVVGTRAPTAYGRRMARRFAADFAVRGVAVVSGLARGVDAEAHEAALDAGGTTWAVLGSDLGNVYPPDNRDLARRIVAEGGCLLSEYPLGVEISPALFPRRNRIVAGLSWATVVVEGRPGSGALSTAKEAVDAGREVFGVPGPADSEQSFAPHKLIKDGARLALSAQEVLAGLPAGAGVAVASGPSRRARAPRLEGQEAQIMGILGGDSLSLDELGRMTGLDMPSLSLIMFGLEVKELVSAVPGQRYAKKTL